ncbi:MAG: hypothetical protein JNM65_08285 [Verrucomicrobiaceae bacterium]|nr:hypothetical protein [Verrucomicrobiaceae bacterium]
MKRFFQLMLGLVFTVVGFFGGWFALLTYRVWRFPWQLCLALLLLVGAVYFFANEKRSSWVRSPSFGFMVGAGTLGVTLSYGRPLESAFLAGIALLLFSGSHWFKAIRASSILFALLLAFGWIIFVADHAVFSGQVYAWKWRVVEHPIFSPTGFSKIEHHGRRTIYVTDTGFVDPCVVAVVWGWQVFPKSVYLGDNEPEGRLIDDPRIKEVIR